MLQQVSSMAEKVVFKEYRWQSACLQKVAEAEPKFGQTHLKPFAIHIGEGIFPVRTESFGDVVLMPGEDSDRLANGNKR